MKMKYSTLFVIPLLVLSLCTFEVGCNSASFATAVARIQAEMPAAQAAATAILSVADPALVPLVAPTASVISTDLAAVNSAIAAYNSTPNATTEAKVQAAVDAILNTVDSNLLQLNGLKTPQAAQAMQYLAAFSAVWAVIDGFIVGVQTPAQAAAHAAQHTAKLEEMLPLLDQKKMQREARLSGAELQASVRHELALGF